MIPQHFAASAAIMPQTANRGSKPASSSTPDWSTAFPESHALPKRASK
jgi:hypothetical protein